jgi:lysophospholipase L1-like esterase
MASSLPPSTAASILRLRQLLGLGPIRFVALGDSITNGSSDHNNGIYGTNCYWNVTQWQSGAKFRCVRQAGWPSQPTTTIVNRFWDEVLPYRPDAMFVLECTNDIGEITGTSPYTYAQVAATALANEAALIKAALGSNIIPIVFAMPPRGTSSAPSTLAAYTQQLNIARAAQAVSLGAIWIDTWTPLADPVNLWYDNPAWTADGIHPTALGAQVMATQALSVLAPYLPSYGAPRAIIHVDYGNSFANPLFYSSNGTTPDTYTFYGTITGLTQSIVTDAFANGNWARVSWAAGAAASFAILQSGTTSCVALRGKRVAFSGRLRTQNVQASGSLVGVQILWYSQAGTVISANLAPINKGDFSLDSPSGISGPGGVFYMEGYCPASAATVEIQVQYTPGGSGTGTVYADVAEFVVFDVRERPEYIETRASKKPRRIIHVTSATSPYQVTQDDDIVIADATSGAVTINLPPVGLNSYSVTGNTSYGIGLPGSGMQYEVIRYDSVTANAVTVAAASGDNIQGAASVSLASQWSKTTVCAVDSNLWINT